MKPSEPEKAVKLFIQFSQNEAFHGEAARSPLLHADIMLMAVQMSTPTPLHVAISYPRWLYTCSLLINLTLKKEEKGFIYTFCQLWDSRVS